MSEESEYQSEEQATERQLLTIAESLGFPKTAELEQLEQRASEGSGLITEWQTLARRIIEQQIDKSSPKPQIGLLVASTELLIKSGNLDDARTELDDAITYAEGIGEFDLAEQLIALSEQLFRTQVPDGQPRFLTKY